jgi:flagellar hook-associated protein 3 FlgL
MQIRLDANTEQFLDRLTETTRRMERAQREISSGKRFTTVSDDPDQVAALLQTRTELESVEQIGQNLSRVKTEVDAAEQALELAETLLERARVYGAAGASGTATAQQRAVLAGQVGGLLEQLVAISNTTVEGRFIFSGDTDGSAAFRLDSAWTPPYGSYLGSGATREALLADGSRVRTSRSGAEVFDAAGASVFAAIEALRSALASGNGAAIETVVAGLETPSDHLRNMHAIYGSAQARVNDGIDTAAKRELQYRSQLGALEDADLALSVVEFQQAKLQRETALQARAQMGRKTLFDYLG